MPYQKHLPSCLMYVTFFLAICRPSMGQQYYTSSEGRANIHFVVAGELSSATANNVEIIYDKKIETIWLTFIMHSFLAEDKTMTKKLFKKSDAHFVIKGKVSQKNVQNEGIDFRQFAFIGRIFNDNTGGPVRVSGRFDFSPENENQGYEFTMSAGIEPKWFGEKFEEMSEYPVVNIHIVTTLLNPIIKQEETVKN